MRKFFCLSAGLAVCTMAMAGEKNLTPVTADKAIKLTPKRFARISPDFKQTSPWMEVGDLSGPAACPPTALAFDCFEPDGGMPGWPTDGLYGLDCGLGTSRWFFGTTYCNMFNVNDISNLSDPGFNGAISERAEWAWWWYAGGPGTSEQCYVAIFTAEEFDDTCGGPAATSYYSGIIFDYGVVGYGGYYFTDSEDTLCGSGLFFQMPTDGAGAYSTILANDFNGSTLFLATCGQPMLWGTKPGNPSQQGPVQWDDDNPSDGTHTAPDECYDYSFGTCPDPMGSMVCFYAEGGALDCLSLEIDNNNAGSPSTFTLSGMPNGGTGAVLYSFRTGVFEFEGLGYCVAFDLFFRNAGEAQSQMVGQGRDTNNDGAVEFTVPVPCAAGGRTIYFQGALKGTCPDVCMSNLLEVTFNPC